MEIDDSATADNWKQFGDVAHEILVDARWRSYAETALAPANLKQRLFAAATKTTLNDAKVHLARVRFGKHRFNFDDAGQWAVVAPVSADHANMSIVDLAAFDPSDETRRQVFCGKGFAVGLEAAMFDARLRSDFRVNIHADLWYWLRSECVGLLPVDWDRTALWLKEWRAGGLVVDDDDQGRKVDLRFRMALKPPPLFVRRAVAA